MTTLDSFDNFRGSSPFSSYIRELATERSGYSPLTNEESLRSRHQTGGNLANGSSRKRKLAHEDKYAVGAANKHVRFEGHVSSPSEESPTSLFSYSDEDDNIYHNIREFFSEPNIEDAASIADNANTQSSGSKKKVRPTTHTAISGGSCAVGNRQSAFRMEAEEYLSLTMAKLRRRLLAAQVQMSLLTSPQLQGDLPLFVERAMQLFYHHNQHLLSNKQGGGSSSNTSNNGPTHNNAPIINGKSSSAQSIPGISSSASMAATTSASTASETSVFEVERRLFVDQALQLYLQQFMPSADADV